MYDLAPIEGVSGPRFIRALHYSGFIVPRNSEWHFAPGVKQELFTISALPPTTVIRAHELLLECGEKEDPALGGSILPRYLFTKGGRAYHEAELGHTPEALALYSQAAEDALSGSQWLAAQLASEQERREVLPPAALETLFLRAMVLHREGKKQAAEPLLRKITSRNEVRAEVAMAMTILGLYVQRRDPREAERLFRRSIEIDRNIGNLRGVALSTHNLANLLSNSSRKRLETENLYQESIATGRGLRNDLHVAQALHSFANFLSKGSREIQQAENLYRESLEIDERFHNWTGVAQTLHSLGNLLSRDRQRWEEAEKLYVRAVKIKEQDGDRDGLGQTLHSQAKLMASSGNPSQAVTLFRRSIKMAKDVRDDFGLAQRLHSFGAFLIRKKRDEERFEGERLLRESLELGVELRNYNHQAQVLRTLSFAVERRSATEAEELLRRALALNRQIGNNRGIALVEESLRRLRASRG
ncbi:MAG TPA: tetratricopeptide repeat protein [Allosphingosinicella sp.]|nr:tetratricopeptide repeat protein [Allosphingosinicella sp.]